jgi:hypothetical protein
LLYLGNHKNEDFYPICLTILFKPELCRAFHFETVENLGAVHKSKLVQQIDEATRVKLFYTEVTSNFWCCVVEEPKLVSMLLLKLL